MLRAWLSAACSAAAALGCGASAQTVSEQYLLAAANQDRAAHHLGELHLDGGLLRSAKLHALEMARHQEIAHQFAGEGGLAERTSAAGVRFSLVTENVAEAPNSALIHELLMQSSGHRANLLDPHVDSIGVAVVQRDGQLYAVEDFARTVQYLTLEEQEDAVKAMLAGKGLVLLRGAQDARATCAISTGYVGSGQPRFVMRYTSAELRRLPEELVERVDTGRYRQAAVGACAPGGETPFSGYRLAVLLYP